MFSTIGAPQRCVTWCSAIAAKILAGSTRRRQTCVPADGGYRPSVSPAVAMEHRQGPQIDRAAVEPERDRIADRIQKSAAMVIDDALGIAGRAGGVVERDRLPFIVAAPTRPLRNHLRQGRLRTPSRRETGRRLRRRFPRAGWVRPGGQRLFDDRREFAVGDEQLGFPCDRMKAIDRASRR